MISKLFIALSVLALTSSVNAAVIPQFARQDPAEAGDLKLSSPLNSILQSAGKGAGGEVASVAVVHIKSALFGPASVTAPVASSATAPVAASSTTSASATGLFARQDDSANLRAPRIKLPPAAPSTINNVLTGAASVAGEARYYLKGPGAKTARYYLKGPGAKAD